MYKPLQKKESTQKNSDSKQSLPPAGKAPSIQASKFRAEQKMIASQSVMPVSLGLSASTTEYPAFSKPTLLSINSAYSKAPIQKMSENETTLQLAGLTPNVTGIPDGMKTRFENLSGFSFDDVRVHYNSDKPAQLQALAYTQGNQVYVAPGQECHLGHELGHVVQQKRGQVQPTESVSGIAVNDAPALESEADLLSKKSSMASKKMLSTCLSSKSASAVQRMWVYRVQDEDAKNKRITVDIQGHVTVNSSPLNISVGYPDHALYFLKEKGPDYDVVEFDVQDDVYYNIVQNLSSQKTKQPGMPTFNDPNQPGFKIEIPNGRFLDAFKAGIVQGSGISTRGNAFLDQNAALMYNEQEVCDMAIAIMEIYPDKMRQVKKLMLTFGLEYIEADNRFDTSEEDIEWAQLNDGLWTIFNTKFDQILRGVEQPQSKKKKKGK